MATASAPGKILWLGAYSVLFPQNIAFVMAVDARSHATASRLEDNRVEFTAKSLGIKASGSIKSGKIIWGPGADTNSLSFATAAIEVSAKFLALKKKRFSGLSLSTWNDKAFGDGAAKTGLGSSAASTVAMVAAILAEFGLPVEKNLDCVHKLSQLAHSKAQGSVGSGFDVSAACYGTIAYSRFSPEIIGRAEEDFAIAVGSPWNFRIHPEGLPQGFEVAAAFTGKSAPTTSLARKVLAFDRRDHRRFAVLMDELNSQNEKAVLFLENLRDLQEKHPGVYGKIAGYLANGRNQPAALKIGDELAYFREFKAAFAGGRRLTKRLGELSGAPIEPDALTALIEESERNGAFCCKLPGAGGGDSIAALCLGRAQKRRLEAFWRGKGLRILEVSEAGGGVRGE
ncbi:MAG: hypothetical protein V1787_01945 [Candidatus Micrarchaeota archaeon]